MYAYFINTFIFCNYTERQERYTLYFIYPVPKLSEQCMYALFSASYSQHAFEKVSSHLHRKRMLP